MHARAPGSLGACAITLTVLSMTPVMAAAQGWSPPLTPDGKPDLQGIWISRSATPLERPKALEGRPLLTDAEVADLQKRADRIFKDSTKADFASGDGVFLAALQNVDQFKSPTATGGADDMVERVFENRTALIVDPPEGRIPPLTSEGQQRLTAATAARIRHNPADPEDLSNDRRCLTFGTPRLGGNFGAGPYSYYQIVQTPGYVVFATEFAHEARIIPLDGRPHLPQDIRQWSGDSRGRWEGKTLIVDSTNFSPKSMFMGSAENLHLVERFTRVAADRIDYELTLEDSTTWTKPWTAVIHLTRTAEKIYEVACHEGNYYTTQGTLAGARAQEKAAEDAAKKRPFSSFYYVVSGGPQPGPSVNIYCSAPQTANPAARGVGLPENAFADVQAVRLGIVLRQLNFRHRRPVFRIQFVDDASVGFHAPEKPVVPGEPVRPHSGRRNRADDFAGLGLHQKELSRSGNGHPVFAVHPLQAVSARRRRPRRDVSIEARSRRHP